MYNNISDFSRGSIGGGGVIGTWDNALSHWQEAILHRTLELSIFLTAQEVLQLMSIRYQYCAKQSS
jgi:hypothetical protein